MKPNTVAGPRPIYTALPHFPCLLNVQVSLRGAANSVNESKKWKIDSGNSNLAPANLLVGQHDSSSAGDVYQAKTSDQEGKLSEVIRNCGILPQWGFWTASTSWSPLPLENIGLSIVPVIRKGNCNFPSFRLAPDNRATVLVKKLSLVVISANPR